MANKLFPVVGSPMLDPEWEQIFHQLYRGAETGLIVSADGGGLRVFVSAGRGGVAGHGVLVPDPVELAIESTASPRTARIVLDTVSPYVRVRYSAPTDTQYLLAEVAVAANAVTIAPGNVTQRSKTPMQELSDSLGVDWANLSGKPSTFPSTWATVSGKPSTFPPSSHTHPSSQITGLKNGATTSFTRGTGNPSGGSSGDVYFQMV